jgi:general secretion pathway protein C
VAALLYATRGWWATAADEPAATIAVVDPGAGDASRKASSGETTLPVPSVPTAKVAGSRYELQGVVAGAAADGAGVALIAVDGGAARAYRVGAAVDSDFVLLGVSPGGAILGPPNGPSVVVLEVVIGATASGATPRPGLANPSVMAAAVPPASGMAAPPTQSAALAAAGTQAGPSTAEGALPLAADDLAPDTVSTAQATSGKPSPGRRMRLRRLNSHP